MKKLLLGMLAFAISFNASAFVVGKVDMQRVLLNVKEGKRIKAKLEKSAKAKEGELKKDEKKIKKMQSDFKKQSLVMNDKAKGTKQQEIQQAILRIQQKTVKFQKELRGMEQKFKKPLFDKIRVIINQVSKSANVDITVETSTAPIMYAKSEKDLTADIIKKYDGKHK